MAFDVFALGNPLYDLQAQVPDSLLDSLAAKGGVLLIDQDQYDQLIPKLAGLPIHATPGGSAANTAIGLQLLGGQACYTGKIGADAYGDAYRTGLLARGVQANLGVGSLPTGLSVILITPDAQRTMFTFLGACQELSAADVNPQDIQQSRYLYVTGYLWDTDSQKEAVLLAMEQARKFGVPIAMSLSDPFCVHRHKADFQQIVEKHVDLLFGNQEEMEVFTDTTTPEAAIEAVRGLCETVVVTMSASGSYIARGDRVHTVAAFPVRAIDTTGAGDMYAAGLLYGLTHGLDLQKTGTLASYVSAQVVAQMGPRLESLDPDAVASVLM